MRKRRARAVSSFFACLLAAQLAARTAAPARAAKVVAFGDSWAALGADELAQEFALRGHPEMTVDNRGVGGSTAEDWARAPQALPNAVSANPDAEHLWLSIGGNDLFEHAEQGRLPELVADNLAHIGVMLDALYAVHPDIEVVAFGYDFVNLVDDRACWGVGFDFLGLPAPDALTPELRSLIALVANTASVDVGDAVYGGLDAAYPRFTYAPLWGALQRAGGLTPAPNLLEPSPRAFFADCIHPNHEGFGHVMARFYDLYWAPLLDGAPPPPAGCATAATGTPAGGLGASLAALAAPAALLLLLRARRA